MKQFLFSALLLLSAALSAQNPILPMWEFIPDGEPYVFEDPDLPGHYRVYLYGSHDNLVTAYCGRDQVVWSAPVDDLSHWRYDGIIFRSALDANGQPLRPDTLADILYAPDVTLRVDADGTKHYYLFPNNQEDGRQTMVCESQRPDGPFRVINWSKENPALTDGSLYFDPAAFVDDDSHAYAYWGFQRSYAGELEADMATVRQPIADFIPSAEQDTVFRFFEASSMRKIGDKYVFIYSRITRDGEDGLPSSNYTLAYAYGDSPLGPLTYGGTLVDGRAPGKDANGQPIPTAYPFGNTHGSLCEINGQWWLFYHRQTGTDEFSRQACVAPVEVKVEKGKGGKVEISRAEFNSEGFRTKGLNPQEWTPAAWACYLTGPSAVRQQYPNMIFSGSYLKAVRPEDTEAVERNRYPVVNNTAGSVVGYKYFDWSGLRGRKKTSLEWEVKPQGVSGTIHVLLGAEPYDAQEIASIQIPASQLGAPLSGTTTCKLPRKLLGKQALYFVFESDTKEKSICELIGFRFRKH